MSKSPEIKAVVFDWDDTCVSTIPPIWALHKFVASTYYNKTLGDEEIKQHWGKPLHELVRHLYEIDDHVPAFEYLAKHKADREYFKKFFDGVEELLGRLALSRKVGLVTAHIREFVQVEFDYLEFDASTFHYIQTSDDTEFHKPDPRVFDPTKQWLASEGIKPEEALYIGDSLLDLQASMGAGLQYLGVTTGLYDQQTFLDAGADSMSSLTALEAYLES